MKPSFSINSNEQIIAAIWDFGDGSATSTELDPTHTYSTAGEFILTIEVTTSDEVKTINQSITIFELPNVSTPITLQQCDDDNDGITDFNLRQSEILISHDSPILNFTYHLDPLEAEQGENAIKDPQVFSNAIANRIYVRVVNQLNCYKVVTLNLQVSTTAIPKDFMLNINECDNDLIDGNDTNGITTFNFSKATKDILDLFPSDQNLIITYYESLADALALQNGIDSSNFRNENSPYSQQIVVRVDNENNNACVGLGFHLTLNTTILPEFDLVDHQFLCLNTLPDPLEIYVENAQDNYTYEWRDTSGNLLVSNETSIFGVTKAGNYFVTAITDKDCSRTKRITIEASNIATIESIDIVDVTESNSITIYTNGEGEYEFALDDINGDYQDENFFDMINGGTHTIFVKDKNGCGIQSKIVIVLNIPKFFTPNGDGINDTWKIDGVFSQPKSKIYIFDKFGKLLKSNRIKGRRMGWLL